MTMEPTPEQAAQRALEEQFAPGYFVRHTVTGRRYFITDTDAQGVELLQAVRGQLGSIGNAPVMRVPWENMPRSFEGGRSDGHSIET